MFSFNDILLPIKDWIINETNILDHSPSCLELYDLNLNYLFWDTA